MIEIHNEKVNGIPLLHIVKAGQYNEMLPLVFFVHGFTSAKEHNLHFAYLLAEKGFRAVLPEANLHGERNEGKSLEEMTYQFWEIVIQTIEELAIIKEEFSNRKLVDDDRIGVVGTSMGGIVTFGALTQYDWIKTAVSLMGSPNYEQFAHSQITELKKAGVKLPFSDEELGEKFAGLRAFDISAKQNVLNNRPILFWHGKRDPVVPFQPTYDFYQQIKDDYKENPEKIKFIIDEQADHKVSREALLETVAWFGKYL